MQINKRAFNVKVYPLQSGFSLMELAIALLILGLFMGGLFNLSQLLFVVSHEQKERANMHTINQAIDTFLKVNAFLPCPDTDGDGLENRTLSSGVLRCTGIEGYFPYREFGVKGLDAWGNAYYYRVNDQADNTTGQVNEVCSSASVFGKSGTAGISNMWRCASTNLYYCKDSGGAAPTCSTSSICAEAACDNTIDPRPAPGSPPYFHLITPPFGSVSGTSNLQIFPEEAAPYTNNTLIMGGDGGSGVVAVVVSWGANGAEVFRYNSALNRCGDGTVAENINCANTRQFVDIKTGENRDYITWVTVNQAKMAILSTGEFR